MSPHRFDARETLDPEEVAWRHQERLLSTLRSGASDDSGDAGYRDVFGALGRESLPALPDDFPVRVAAHARRLADAHAQVSRFRTMLASLLSLLYVPAMIAAALFYWSPWQRAAAHAPPGDHPLSLWMIVIAVLALSIRVADGWMRRASADPSG